MNARAKEMAAAIKTETNGRFDLQIFPNNQLGSDTDMLSQIRSGGVEFFTLSGLILATLVPAASISGIGFAFPDYATVWKAMDGGLGAYVRGEIAKSGLVVMDNIWDNGFRQTTSSSKPINHPDDFKGFKIRVPAPRSGPRCSRRSMPHRRRSISAKSIPRCRPRSSRGRKIRWRSSRPQSSTKCRNSVR
jgi:TRAP-type C4-dicarboxylate transport system substrate-binding protein